MLSRLRSQPSRFRLPSRRRNPRHLRYLFLYYQFSSFFPRKPHRLFESFGEVGYFCGETAAIYIIQRTDEKRFRPCHYRLRIFRRATRDDRAALREIRNVARPGRASALRRRRIHLAADEPGHRATCRPLRPAATEAIDYVGRVAANLSASGRRVETRLYIFQTRTGRAVPQRAGPFESIAGLRLSERRSRRHALAALRRGLFPVAGSHRIRR